MSIPPTTSTETDYTAQRNAHSAHPRVGPPGRGVPQHCAGKRFYTIANQG